MNCLPTHLLFDAGLRYIFVEFKFDKDTHSQFECSLSNRSQKWRNIFNLPNFDCKNHSMTSQGLIDYLYATAFGKKPCIYHMATYNYIYRMYDGKHDVEQVSEIFSPKNYMRCFKEFTIKR